MSHAGLVGISRSNNDIRELIRTGRTTLYGLNFMEELDHHGGSKDLAWLVQMVAKQQLKTSIEVEASWN